MRGFRLGRIGGVEIRADLSWFVVVVLVAVSMIGRVSAVHDASVGVSMAVGIGAAVLFFLSILLHELAHAAVSTRLGLPVQDITLFLFGGATRTRAEQRTAREELLITAAGPATSLALAGVLGAAVALVGGVDEPVMGTIGYLAWINLALGLFNLAPAYPLDGGRLLRAALWSATGDRDRATRIAATAGEVGAWMLISFGLFSLFGGAGGGLWLALIGWFLLQSARGEHVRQAMRTELAGVTAEEVMRTGALTLGQDLTVGRALERVEGRSGPGSYPVVDDLGAYVGMVTRDELLAVEPAERERLVLLDVVHRIPDGTTADAAEPMTAVLDHLDGPDAQVVVVTGNRHTVVGVISPQELLQWARRREAQGPGPTG